MPLDFADALYRHLLADLPPTRAYTRADLDRLSRPGGPEALPRPVAALLRRTLDRWLARERERLHSDWFDFDDPDVRVSGDRYFAALSATARVPAVAWEETLEGAVRLVVRYLVTPARALTDAVFEGAQEPLPSATVRERLALFEAYPYLPEIAGAYLDQKRPETVDPDTLYGLLSRIDRRMAAEAGVEEWLRLLGPLFRLARRVPELDGTPAPLLARFFAAKGVDALAERLEARGEAVLDMAAVRTLLTDTLAPPPGEEPVPEADAEAAAEVLAPEDDAPISEVEDVGVEDLEAEDSEAEGSETEDSEIEDFEAEDTEDFGVEDSEPEPEERHAVAEPAVAARSLHRDAPAPAPEAPEDEPEPESDPEPVVEEAVPLWQRFAANVDRDATQAEAQAASPVPEEPDEAPDEPQHEADEEAVPLWRRFAVRRSAADHPGPQPREAVEDVEEAAPPAGEEVEALERRVFGKASVLRRRRFVRHLFGGDETAYAAVLRKLSTAPTWTEAAETIARDVFRRHHVDIYSEHAIAFTDAVEARYHA